MVGQLYPEGDKRRDAGFSIFYMGINLGAFLSPIVVGFLAQAQSSRNFIASLGFNPNSAWHWGFGAAGVGMLAGLVIYISGGKYLPEQRRLERSAARSEPIRNAKETVLLLVGIILAVTIFRGAYEQVGNTVALWADAGIDRTTSLMTIPGSWFQALNPLFVVVMTPPLLAWWKRRAAAGQVTSSMRKMATGALIVAGSYLLLALADAQAGGERANWVWLAGYFVVLTFGELFILPTGLGLFARLAPPSLGATMIAAWFFAIFTGSLSAGLVGRLWSHMGHAQYFVLLAGVAALSAVVLLALDRATRRIEGERAAEVAAGLSGEIA